MYDIEAVLQSIAGSSPATPAPPPQGNAGRPHTATGGKNIRKLDVHGLLKMENGKWNLKLFVIELQVTVIKTLKKYKLKVYMDKVL